MGYQLNIVEVTGSTNDDLLKAGKVGAPHGYGLAARRQTAGRGRRGHKWDSTEGNLLLSIILRPDVAPEDYSGLAAVCGLAVIEELESLGLADEVRLKWPNDLYAHGKKLGGILIEASAVSLMDLNEHVHGVDDLLRAIHGGVVEQCDSWARVLKKHRNGRGPLFPVIDEYLGHLAWLEREVVALSTEGTELMHGTFKTVDNWGQAVLATSGGLRSFPFELASLRRVE